MNAADKSRLYREARRVLLAGGRLAIWDITAGEAPEPDYPLPWADRAGVSHLVGSDRPRAVVESSGFSIEHWDDRTDQAAETMQAGWRCLQIRSD